MKKICKMCGTIIFEGDHCPTCGGSSFRECPETTGVAQNAVDILGKELSGNGKSNRSGGAVETVLQCMDLLSDEQLLDVAMYIQNGIGLKKDVEAARTIYEALAYRGNTEGMYRLALMYLLQLEPDQDLACKWLSIAANAGHKASQIKLHMLSQNKEPLVLNEDVKPEKTTEKSGKSDEAKESDIKNIVQKALPHVLLIETSRNKCGTGFCVEGGYVITNAHVVNGKPRVIMGQFESRYKMGDFLLKCLRVYPEYDLAVLSIVDPTGKIKTKGGFQLKTERPEYGDEIFTIGNPIGYKFSLSVGHVSNPEQKQKQDPRGIDSFIQVDLSANPGNSGGPLIDMQNRVVGVLTCIPSRTKGGITLCVPAEYVQKAIKGVKNK